MPLRDLLLFAITYPQRTPAWAIQRSSDLAEQLGAHLSVACCQKILPQVGNWLADQLVHANDLVAAENANSRKAAQALLSEFSETTKEATRGEQILIECGPAGIPAQLATRARVHDLTIVPIEPDLEYEVAAEELMFNSGRPVLLLPKIGETGGAMDKIVIGWDGSRSATRALSESMPFLSIANSIEVVIVTDDKKLNADCSSNDLLRHLECHGLKVVVVEVPADGQDAGVALMRHSASTRADLLVMGAYGHSRTREFVLGGATRSVLGRPQLPVLIAH